MPYGNFPKSTKLPSSSKQKSKYERHYTSTYFSQKWLQCMDGNAQALQRKCVPFPLQPASSAHKKRQHTLIALSKKGERAFRDANHHFEVFQVP